MSDRYGVVLVGCGTVAGYGHLPAIAANRRARLIGVVDRDPARAADCRERFGAETCGTDLGPYLERSDVRIVVITTWPSSHARIAIDSLNAGKHVLTEKPISNSVQSALAMVEASKASGRKLMVGYVLRHNEAYRKAAEMIHAGALGRPIIMRLLGGEDVPTREAWLRDLALLKDTSPLIDCGVHYVDVMRWFTGAEAISVSGVGVPLRPEIPAGNYSYGVITVRMDDGSAGIYEVGWDRSIRQFSEKEFIGPGGRIRLGYGSIREGAEVVQTIDYFTPGKGSEVIQVNSPVKQMDNQFETFLDCIERDVDLLPSLNDAVRSLDIVLAGDRAIREGRTVTLLRIPGETLQNEPEVTDGRRTER